MKVLIKEKLSPHKSKTPEGYLICQDAILARTGKQEYLESELFPESGSDKIISVDRKPEQVFAPETLASFENKPVTVEHPAESVTPENFKDLAVGFVRDIKKRKVDGQDVIVGNLIITDAETIENIENGVRTELSCGYDCDITDGPNPEQVNIRGNHVALCEQGRAGIAKIIDSVPSTEANATVKDDAHSDLINSLKRLIKEEEDAIDSYQRAISENPKNEKAKELFEHIQKEEEEHLEELESAENTGKPEIIEDTEKVEDVYVEDKDVLKLAQDWCKLLERKKKEENPKSETKYEAVKGYEWVKVLEDGKVAAFIDKDGKIYLADTPTRPFKEQRGDITQPPLSIKELYVYDVKNRKNEINDGFKYVIYKKDGKFKGTPYKNYIAETIDESKVQDFDDYNSFKEVVDYLQKHTDLKEREIMNGAMTTDSFLDSYSKVFYKKKDEILEDKKEEIEKDKPDFDNKEEENNFKKAKGKVVEELDKQIKDSDGGIFDDDNKNFIEDVVDIVKSYDDYEIYGNDPYVSNSRRITLCYKGIKKQGYVITLYIIPRHTILEKNRITVGFGYDAQAIKAINNVDELKNLLDNFAKEHEQIKDEDLIANVKLDKIIKVPNSYIQKDGEAFKPLFNKQQMIKVDEALKKAGLDPEWNDIKVGEETLYHTSEDLDWKLYDTNEDLVEDSLKYCKKLK